MSYFNARRLHGLTLNHTNAGFSLGTTSTYTTAAATVTSIGGKFNTALAAQTNTASPTLDAVTGVAPVVLPVNPLVAGSGDVRFNCATVVVVGITASGAIRYAQGSIVATALGIASTPGAFLNAPQFPGVPDDFTPIAYFLVRTSPNASAWTLGTSTWNATGITCSAPVNISTLPDRPQTA